MRVKEKITIITLALLTAGCASVPQGMSQQTQPPGGMKHEGRDTKKQAVIGPSNYDHVHLFDQRHWALAEPQRVLLTEDGGKTWRVVFSIENPTESYNQIKGLRFTDERTGFVIVGGRVSGGRLLKTTDGGARWEDAGLISKSGEEITFENCYFVDALRGWAVGLAWTSQTSADSRVPQYIGVVLATRDGGRTWERQHVNAPKREQSAGARWSLRDVFFRDERTGWAVGDAGMIFRTEDGGDTWHATSAGDADYRRVDFLNEEFGWAAYRYGNSSWGLAITSSGGREWKLLDEQFTYGTWPVHAEFLSPTHGFAVSLQLYETRDGGRTWKRRDGGSDADDTKYDYLSHATDGTLVAFGVRKSQFVASVSTDKGLTWRATNK